MDGYLFSLCGLIDSEFGLFQIFNLIYQPSHLALGVCILPTRLALFDRVIEVIAILSVDHFF